MNWLDATAGLATIVTAGVTAYGYSTYRRNIYRRRLKIEEMLKKKNQPNDDSLTLEQIAAPLKLTIEQVLEAASGSNMIEGLEGLTGKERRLRYRQKPN